MKSCPLKKTIYIIVCLADRLQLKCYSFEEVAELIRFRIFQKITESILVPNFLHKREIVNTDNISFNILLVKKRKFIYLGAWHQLHLIPKMITNCSKKKLSSDLTQKSMFENIFTHILTEKLNFFYQPPIVLRKKILCPIRHVRRRKKCYKYFQTKRIIRFLLQFTLFYK